MSLQVTMCTLMKKSSLSSNNAVCWRQEMKSSNSRSEVSNATTSSRSASRTRVEPNELNLREGIMMNMRRRLLTTVGCRQDQLQVRQLHSFWTRLELGAQSSRVFQQDQMRVQRQLQSCWTRSELGTLSSRVLQQDQIKVRQLHSFPPPTISSGEQIEVEALAHKDMAVRCSFLLLCHPPPPHPHLVD